MTTRENEKKRPYIQVFVALAVLTAIEVGVAGIELGAQDGRRYVMVATAVRGIIFVSIQAFEWAELLAEGILPSTSQFGATFYALTGFHGAHVTFGVIWILWSTIKAFRGGYDEDHLGVELAGLYWHFVDLVWIILFTLVYLI